MHEGVKQKVKEAIDDPEQVSLFTFMQNQGLPISKPLLSSEILKSMNAEYMASRTPK